MARIERVFVDSDTQFDFMEPAGRLYVPNAVEIHEAIRRLFRFADRHRVPVFSPVDEHPEDDAEFAQFPPHCVRGSPGQKKLPFTLRDRHLVIRADGLLTGLPERLLADYDQLIFPKNTFSVFCNPHFGQVIDALEVGEYVVFGVALDYCVWHVAMGLLDRNRTVTIVQDAVRAITPAGGEDVLRRLAARGARCVGTDDLVG